MEGMLLPGCALVFSILLIVVYFSRPHVDIKENKLYIIMMIAIVLDSLTAFALQALCLNGITIDELGLVDLFNRLDFLSLITYSTSLFIYIHLITIKNSKNNLNKLGKILMVIDLIFIIIMSTQKIDLISDGTRYSITGGAAVVTFCVCGLYVLGSFITVLFNRKKVDRRHIPLAVVIVLIIMDLMLFILDPYFVVISITLTFLNYVMYFTIENPDVKMLNIVEASKDEAERANQAKTDFLSSMSHEIRTPLNAIVGFSECIQKEDSLDKAKEDAKDIISASNSLLEIVNGILDISKIEAGKMELVNKDYDLTDVATKLAKLVSTRIGEKPIVMNTYFAPDIPGTLYGDESKIRQIMSNVLVNAVKYTERGNIDFGITCINEGTISKLVISVEDTGRGIKPEKIDSLFNKFERLEEDRNTTLEGTGLGLAITKKLVEMMNGKIVVQSKYGEGTKFTIYIPQTIKSMNKTKKEDVSLETNEYPNKKVLVVDDNKLNIKIESRMLTDYKINIDSAESGDEAINKITNNDYDLILMDDMMPKMSGTATMKKLKENKDFKTPIVVLTANAIDGMKEKYLEDGFDDYLAKPMDKVELRRVLNKYLLDGEITANSDMYGSLPSDLYTITEEDKVKIDKLMPKMDNTKEETPVEIKEEVSTNKGSREFLEKNGINVQAGLDLLGDMEMYNETINSFINETNERIPKMKEYKDSNNMKDYAILAHAMKSDSKYLGFTKLAELSLDHELKGKEDNATYVNEHYDELINEVDRIMNVIKEYV